MDLLLSLQVRTQHSYKKHPNSIPLLVKPNDLKELICVMNVTPFLCKPPVCRFCKLRSMDQTNKLINLPMDPNKVTCFSPAAKGPAINEPF